MPSGQNAFNQLLKGKRKRSKGSIEVALKESWLLIRVCRAALDDAMEREDFEQVHRFVALEIAALRAYGSLALPADLEIRLRMLEAGRTNGHAMVMTEEIWEKRYNGE